jgi:hypothetical protein
MQEYGYLFNKLNKDVKKFSPTQNLSIKNTSSNGDVFVYLGCVIAIIIAYRLC